MYRAGLLGIAALCAWGQPAAQTRVIAIDANYAIAPGGRSGFFTSGQPADVVLSAPGFNRSGGPLLFHHPRNLAGDGQRLLLADSNNNRVLVWTSPPSENTAPDLVLGQPDFDSNDPAADATGMNWPGQIAVTPDGRVVVADSYNNRLLVWNSFPSANGQPADLIIKTPELIWPWGVWTDGDRLVATSTGGRAILFWNNFPIEGSEPPSFTIRNDAIGTPRTITSDGQRLIVGDHNAFQTRIGNFFWKSFPASSADSFDFFMPDPLDRNAAWMQGTFLPGGGLAMLGRTLHIWDQFPEDENTRPAISINGYSFAGGDGGAVVAAAGRLYIPEYNGNRIAVYNTFPQAPSHAPDFSIGSPDLRTNTLRTEFLITNPAPISDGKSLFATSDFERRMYVWKAIPDESAARPDFVYELPFAPWDNAIHRDRLVIAGKDALAVWNQLPRNGELPSLLLRGRIGSITPREIRGVALDDSFFYLADQDAGRVWVWRDIPADGQEPLFALDIRQPARISTDGKHLVITASETHAVHVYAVAGLNADSRPRISSPIGMFNLPQGARIRDNQLFVADTTGNRVFCWQDLEDFVARRPASAILGTSGPTPQIGRTTLFRPGVPSFDGSYLWIGEFKFSGRMPRFSVQP
jgi:hypothetical protein